VEVQVIILKCLDSR